jgi:hypothetical protein
MLYQARTNNVRSDAHSAVSWWLWSVYANCWDEGNTDTILTTFPRTDAHTALSEIQVAGHNMRRQQTMRQLYFSAIAALPTFVLMTQ